MVTKFQYNFKKKASLFSSLHVQKKAISEIISTLLIVALVMALSAVIWSVSKGLVSERIDESTSCFGNFGKVAISKQYTCVNTTSNEIRASLSVGEIEIDGILVSVSGDSGAKSFELKNNKSYSYVKNYNGNYGGNLTLPGKNSALTYIINRDTMGVSDADSLSIAPIINNNQCEVSDTLSNIDNCLLSA